LPESSQGSELQNDRQPFIQLGLSLIFVY